MKMITMCLIVFVVWCGPSKSHAASVEDMLLCQTKASILAGAADARDRNFPAEVYIKGQLQTRLRGADEGSILVLRKLVEVAYVTYAYDSPEQLRYSFIKWCMANTQEYSNE